MKGIFSGITITILVMVLGVGIISPAAAATTHILLQGCDTPSGATVNCTVVWDTNSNGVCEAGDVTINLVIKEEFVSMLQEKLSICG